MLETDLETSASATAFQETEPPAARLTTSADQSEPFVLHVTTGIRIISDDLQWIVQVRKGKASAKSSGWRSRHFCRSRVGLQLAIRRILGRNGVAFGTAQLITATAGMASDLLVEYGADMGVPAILTSRPFAEMGLKLAERGLAVIPCPGDDGKSPRGAIAGYHNWRRRPGPDTIRHFAAEYGDANIGIITSLSGLTIADVDEDGRDAAEIIRRAGDTPLITRTPSGGLHLWYRSAGERNANLRSLGLAVDVKESSAGIVIVPPSYRRSTGALYMFERGGWDDLYRLPTAKPGSLSVHSSGTIAPPLPIARGQRNSSLFKMALREARHCDDCESLFDALTTINDGLVEPLPTNEVLRLTTSAWWRYEATGANWVGQAPRAVLEQDTVKQLAMTSRGADGLMLLTILLVAHGARRCRGEPFAVSPSAMSGTVLPWGFNRIRKARQALIELGFLIEDHRGGSSPGDPSLFRFGGRVSV
jgi:hypothetical protein